MNAATRVLNTRSVSHSAVPAGMTRAQLGMCGLIFALLLSAFATVYAKDLSRRLFIQYQSLQQEKTAMEVRWSKLMLEESAWSAQSRIQQIAQRQLSMKVPTVKQTVLIPDFIESDT